MIPNPIIVVLATISLFAIAITGAALYVVTAVITLLFWFYAVSRIVVVAAWRRVRP